jgi:transcriptional regulator with XRE-family HTH domain
MPKVNYQALGWAREAAGLSLSDAVDKLGIKDARGIAAVDRLAAIESGDAELSRRLLLKMAQCYRRPLGTFYMNVLPRKEDRSEDLRNLRDRQAGDEAPIEALVSDIPASNGNTKVTPMRVKHIPRESRSISRAPLSFALSVLATALIVWTAMDWYYESTILSIERELKRTVAERDDYRVKLKGASPDQAASKIAHLEDELAVVQTSTILKEKLWQALTPNQIDSLSAALRRYPVSSLSIYFVDQYSASFRESLYEVFRRALWPPPVTDAAYGTGIAVRSRPDEGPAFALVSLLKGLGYQVSHVTEGENTRGRIQIYIWNKPQ